MTQTIGIITALAKALPELEGAKKRSLNPHFKNRYADLGAVMEAIEPIAAHGLWYRQIMLDCENGIKLETRYIHESNSELSAGILFMPALKNDPQAYGSALSYCKRYSLQCAFGLASEDDDAEAATKGIQRVKEQPDPRINKEQVATLLGLGDAVEADMIAFCKATKIDSIPDIFQKDYQAAVNLLTKKNPEAAKQYLTGEK